MAAKGHPRKRSAGRSDGAQKKKQGKLCYKSAAEAALYFQNVML
jgi:hypothetical protein